eukprot:2934037-Rhodomonas_salina.1
MGSIGSAGKTGLLGSRKEDHLVVPVREARCPVREARWSIRTPLRWSQGIPRMMLMPFKGRMRNTTSPLYWQLMSTVAVTWCRTVRREQSGRRTEHTLGSSTRVIAKCPEPFGGCQSNS